ncbi:hypothetical protein BDAP_001482 [Binucleata daphniae]
MQKQLIVPDFSPKELLSYFSSLNISLSISDISKPSSLLCVFESLLYTLKSVRITDTLPSDFTDTQYILSIFTHLCNFLESIHYYICLKDIYHPESKKIISILSQIANFSMYRDSKRKCFEEVMKIYNEKEEMCSSIDDKIKQAKQKLEENKQKKMNTDKIKTNLIEEHKNIDEILLNKMKELRAIKNELENTKKENEEIVDKLSSNQLKLLNLKQELSCLKTQIVSDPKKLKELLYEMRSVVNREKDFINTFENKKVEKKDELNVLDTNIAILKERIKNEVIYKNMIEKRNEVKNIKDRLYAEYLQNETQINNMKAKNEFLNKQYSHIENKIQNWVEEHKNSSSEIGNRIEVLKSNRKTANKTNTEFEDKIEENNKKIKEIEYECNKILSETEKENYETKNQIFVLKEKIDIFFYELTKLYSKI